MKQLDKEHRKNRTWKQVKTQEKGPTKRTFFFFVYFYESQGAADGSSVGTNIADSQCIAAAHLPWNYHANDHHAGRGRKDTSGVPNLNYPTGKGWSDHSVPSTGRERSGSATNTYKIPKGFNGRSCLLRTICEAAEAKFSHSSGIIGELLHILLTPSTTPEEPAPEGKEDIHVPHEEYKRAELVASRSSPRTRFAGSSVCSDMYAECPFSLLDLFSGIL